MTEETSVDKHNIACESTVSSLLNIDINLLNNTTEKKTSDVSVVIKHPNGDVIMRHVKDPNARSIVRNIALCNWKSAAFSIIESLSSTSDTNTVTNNMSCACSLLARSTRTSVLEVTTTEVGLVLEVGGIVR